MWRRSHVTDEHDAFIDALRHIFELATLPTRLQGWPFRWACLRDVHVVRRTVDIHPSCAPLANRWSPFGAGGVARWSTAMRAATAALPQGPSFRSGLCCPSPSTLTRPHPPHSRAHRDFAAQRFIRDAFAVPWPRRPASGSVLSLRVLCRHATLYRPRGVRRLHTPSSLTGDAGLHTTLIVRHSRRPH